MKIHEYDHPFPFIRILNFYDEYELSLIWKELEFILNENTLLDPSDTGTAITDGVILKKNKGIFIDDLYTNRNTSHILRCNRKLFSVINQISKKSKSWFFKNFFSNWDITLVSYYENNDHYLKHTDDAFVTSLTWIYKEPKKFKGGDLYFSDYDIEIKIENNSLILFPSSINHEVSVVTMENENIGKNNGRICISQFFGISL